MQAMTHIGRLVLAGLLGVVLAGAAAAVELPGPMVDAAWLQANLDDVTVIDVRDDTTNFTTAPRFSTPTAGTGTALLAVGGHIAGAHPVAGEAIRTMRRYGEREVGFMLPAPFEFESLMRDAGVDAGAPIVIVSTGADVGAMDLAARLFWSLKTYGTTDVAILNGGMAAWLQAGYPYTTEAADLFPGDWSAGKENDTWTAHMDDVAKARAGGVQLVDARGVPEYLGLEKKDVVAKYGHIPGAHNFPTDAIVRHDGTAAYFLSADAYRQVLPALGLKADAPTITYCNTGHLSAGAWFVWHEILGNEATRMYDGSMLEWAQEGRPVEPGNAALLQAAP